MKTDALTENELKIVRLVTAGKTMPEICREVAIGPVALRQTKSRIRKKLGLPVWGWPLLFIKERGANAV